MHWSERRVDVDGPAAAVIAAGMKAVARADGDVHPRELEMIHAFETEVGVDGVPDARSSLATEGLQETYVRSLVMVALADGVVSDEERRVIQALTAAVGIDTATLDRLTREVKEWFLARFDGVSVFSEAVEAIRAELLED